MPDQAELLRQAFIRQVDRPEGQIDLVEAALTIARIAYPQLDASLYQRGLDALGRRLRPTVAEGLGAGTLIAGMNHLLFAEEGFRGNQQDYFDPDNSYLNRVMDRKIGIPITLSLVYMETGRRAGLNLDGIPLPGRFIVGLFHASGWLYIDVFNGGEILSEEECRQRAGPQPGAECLAPAGKRAILKRLLRNLRAIYQYRHQNLMTLELLQWILILDPDSADDLKQRGLLYEALGNRAQARLDLTRYLDLVPEATDRETIEQKISQLNSRPGWLH
jgi:regulator of sirC expression with transglutaminase-like and TPR domain